MYMFIMGILKLLKSQTLKKVNILQNLPNSNGIYPIGIANQNIILLHTRIRINAQPNWEKRSQTKDRASHLRLKLCIVYLN